VRPGCAARQRNRIRTEGEPDRPSELTRARIATRADCWRKLARLMIPGGVLVAEAAQERTKSRRGRSCGAARGQEESNQRHPQVQPPPAVGSEGSDTESGVIGRQPGEQSGRWRQTYPVASRPGLVDQSTRFSVTGRPEECGRLSRQRPTSRNSHPHGLAALQAKLAPVSTNRFLSRSELARPLTK